VTQVGEDTVLINPEWVDTEVFADYRQIEVDASEEHGANAVRVGNHLIYPTSFPRTQKKLVEAGIPVTAVDVSELQKAEGAVTCCSLLFRESVAR
ncbi:MAG: dimethylargininase, partial [Rhodanobacteraceae bacterium]